ncbi:MAG: DUF47 family protein [Firmicutes bacterium]|nr:DUF47 family protein [Bacillota bacterium]
MFKKSSETNYFDIFVKSSEYAYKAIRILDSMLGNFPQNSYKLDEIMKIENEADKHLHIALEKLNKAFITPIEREDILNILNDIDDVIDNIDDVAQKLVIYHITTIRDDMKKFSELAVRCCKALMDAMIELKSYKRGNELKKYIVEINNIEEEGDELLKKSMSELFKSEANPIEIIKWKDIYAGMEDLLDSCEDVADILEVVILKNS